MTYFTLPVRAAVLYYRPAMALELKACLTASESRRIGPLSSRDYFFLGLAKRETQFHLAASTEHRQAPKRLRRRVIMIGFSAGRIVIDRAFKKFTSLTSGGTKPRQRRVDIPCVAPSVRSRPFVSLPNTDYQVGHHEKNVNKRNPGRGVAHGDGRWPAPLRSEHRVTIRRT